ncbi:MAG: dTDP-4-dehydrorhamnose 3,5-epimerase [Pseudomonadota bacterium]
MFQRLAIPDLILVTPKRHGDARGYFSETYRETDYAAAGITGPFVQDNQAFSEAAGVLRGLHFQIPPAAQAKLISCTQGAIFDVAVDLRPGSPTFGQYASAELSAENGHQLFVPDGFAHGYLTLSENCMVQYKVTDYYSPHDERGLAWNDPEVGIAWPISDSAPILSKKDTTLPNLKALTPVLEEFRL